MELLKTKLEKEINKIKSNYSCEKQLEEQENQELLKQIEKLKFTEQYVSDNSDKAIRDCKDRLQKEKDKAKEEIDKLIHKLKKKKNIFTNNIKKK
jgi:hypothetical protein